MAGWLGSQGLPHFLTHDDAFDRRQVEAFQLRELYLGWSPTPEQAQSIVATFGHHADDPLGDVALSLLIELPIFTGHIILQWLKAFGTPQEFPVPLYMNVLRHQAASKYSNGHASSRQMEELLRKAADSMKAGPRATADEYFVRDEIVRPALSTLRGGSMTQSQKRNLAVAIQVASFRQYLAICVLDEVERELQHR